MNTVLAFLALWFMCYGIISLVQDICNHVKGETND